MLFKRESFDIAGLTAQDVIERIRATTWPEWFEGTPSFAPLDASPSLCSRIGTNSFQLSKREISPFVLLNGRVVNRAECVSVHWRIMPTRIGWFILVACSLGSLVLFIFRIIIGFPRDSARDLVPDMTWCSLVAFLIVTLILQERLLSRKVRRLLDESNEPIEPSLIRTLRAKIRIDGQVVDPRLVVAGDDRTHGDFAFEFDIDEEALRHDLEEGEVDFGGQTLAECVAKDIELGLTARSGYLTFVRPPPKVSRWLFGLIRKPPLPSPQWAWVSTSEVREGDHVVTFVGRAIRIESPTPELDEA
jgi:hypothetical protein